MRLLFISAFYPPYEIGGWEQLTEELVNHLRAQGNDIQVLTSSFGVKKKSTQKKAILNGRYALKMIYFITNQPIFSYSGIPI